MSLSDKAESETFSIKAQVLLYTGTVGSPLHIIFKRSGVLDFVREHVGSRDLVVLSNFGKISFTFLYS